MQELVIGLYVDPGGQRAATEKKKKKKNQSTATVKEGVFSSVVGITLTTDDNVSWLGIRQQRGVFTEGVNIYIYIHTTASDCYHPLFQHSRQNIRGSVQVKYLIIFQSTPFARLRHVPPTPKFSPLVDVLETCPLVERESVLLASSIASVMDEDSRMFQCCDRQRAALFSFLSLFRTLGDKPAPLLASATTILPFYVCYGRVTFYRRSTTTTTAAAARDPSCLLFFRGDAARDLPFYPGSSALDYRFSPLEKRFLLVTKGLGLFVSLFCCHSFSQLVVSYLVVWPVYVSSIFS